MRNKILIAGALATTITVCVAGMRPPVPSTGEYTNLQVLPAGISSKQLTRIMVDGFTDDLGVSCNFCHAENKDTHKPDYASDEKPEKEIARAMMRMTIGINRQYFELKTPMIGDSVLAITCGTCHHGQPRPDNAAAQ